MNELVKASNEMPNFTEAAISQAQSLIDSKLLPQAITTPQQALIIIEKGKITRAKHSTHL